MKRYCWVREAGRERTRVRSKRRGLEVVVLVRDWSASKEDVMVAEKSRV